MPLHLFAIEERQALKEFRQALETGETERIVERHDDEMLLQLLQRRRNPWRKIFWGVAIMVFLLLTLALQLWLLGQVFLPFSGAAWFHLDDSESKRRSTKAWHAISLRVEAASLQTLLAVHRLNIKELVRFTLRQLRPQWAGYPVLDTPQRQAAALGYLALATLKQPGAEKPNRSGINATHTHLSKAIQEYHKALNHEEL